MNEYKNRRTNSVSSNEAQFDSDDCCTIDDDDSANSFSNDCSYFSNNQTDYFDCETSKPNSVVADSLHSQKFSDVDFRKGNCTTRYKFCENDERDIDQQLISTSGKGGNKSMASHSLMSNAFNHQTSSGNVIATVGGDASSVSNQWTTGVGASSSHITSGSGIGRRQSSVMLMNDNHDPNETTTNASCPNSKNTVMNDLDEISSSMEEPFSHGRRFGLVGMKNLGNTCFMNAAIQCLLASKSLVEAILFADAVDETVLDEKKLESNEVTTRNPNKKADELLFHEKQKLTSEFRKIVQKVYKFDEKKGIFNQLGVVKRGENDMNFAKEGLRKFIISQSRDNCSLPIETLNLSRFKSVLSAKHAQFSGYQQHDSQEFITLLLHSMDEECTRKSIISMKCETEELTPSRVDLNDVVHISMNSKKAKLDDESTSKEGIEDNMEHINHNLNSIQIEKEVNSEINSSEIAQKNESISDFVAKNSSDFSTEDDQRSRNCIISKNCQGEFRNEIKCGVCQFRSITYEPFTYLSLSLPGDGLQMNLSIFVINIQKQSVEQHILEMTQCHHTTTAAAAASNSMYSSSTFKRSNIDIEKSSTEPEYDIVGHVKRRLLSKIFVNNDDDDTATAVDSSIKIYEMTASKVSHVFGNDSESLISNMKRNLTLWNSSRICAVIGPEPNVQTDSLNSSKDFETKADVDVVVSSNNLNASTSYRCTICFDDNLDPTEIRIHHSAGSCQICMCLPCLDQSVKFSPPSNVETDLLFVGTSSADALPEVPENCADTAASCFDSPPLSNHADDGVDSESSVKSFKCPGCHETVNDVDKEFVSPVSKHKLELPIAKLLELSVVFRISFDVVDSKKNYKLLSFPLVLNVYNQMYVRRLSEILAPQIARVSRKISQTLLQGASVSSAAKLVIVNSTGVSCGRCVCYNNGQLCRGCITFDLSEQSDSENESPVIRFQNSDTIAIEFELEKAKENVKTSFELDEIDILCSEVGKVDEVIDHRRVVNDKGTTFDIPYDIKMSEIDELERNFSSLDQCFQEFSKSERLDESHNWVCPECEECRPVIKTLYINRLPDTLIVCLKRFIYIKGENVKCKNTSTDLQNSPVQQLPKDKKSNLRLNKLFGSAVKLDKPVLFPTTQPIDLSKYVYADKADSSANGKTTSDSYLLYGIVNHFGSVSGGHYTAHTRNLMYDGDWNYFDDSDVKESLCPGNSGAVGCDFATVSSNLSKDYSSAYIMFFQRR